MPSGDSQLFFYLVTAALTASGTVTATLQIQADSQFQLCYINGMSSADAADEFMPNNFECLISNESNATNLSNGRIPQRLLCAPANGVQPERLSIIFQPQDILRFDFLNLTANPLTVQLVLKGYKLFV